MEKQRVLDLIHALHTTTALETAELMAIVSDLLDGEEDRAQEALTFSSELPNDARDALLAKLFPEEPMFQLRVSDSQRKLLIWSCRARLALTPDDEETKLLMAMLASADPEKEGINDFTA